MGVTRPGPPRRLPSLLRILTHTQNASALVFSVFLGAHLVSPLAAAVGGTRAADGVMMIAREYYLPLEPVVVVAPLLIHILSSVLRRLIITFSSTTPPPTSSSSTSSWIPSLRIPSVRVTTHQLLGYILIPLTLPHFLLHRILPQSPSAPIHALSPSEFGYEFAGYATRTRIWMGVGYVVLVAVGVWHGLVGGMKVLRWVKRIKGGSKGGSSADGTRGGGGVSGDGGSEMKEGDEINGKRKIGKGRKIGLRGIVALITGLTALGLTRMAYEADAIGTFATRRHDAVFASAPWATYLR